MGGACSWYGRDEKCVQYFVETPEWKRPPERLGVDVNGSYGSKVGKCGLDSSGSGWGPMADSC